MGIAGEHRFTGLDGADQAWCSFSGLRRVENTGGGMWYGTKARLRIRIRLV